MKERQTERNFTDKSGLHAGNERELVDSIVVTWFGKRKQTVVLLGKREISLGNIFEKETMTATDAEMVK